MRLLKAVIFLLFVTKQEEDKGNDNADDDAGCDGKIKGNFFTLDEKIPGETSHPGNFISRKKEKPYTGRDQTDDNENFSELRKLSHEPPHTDYFLPYCPIPYKWSDPYFFS
jgi:hypothetical protein